MDAQATVVGHNFAIDPFREATAYETLMALKNGSESKLEHDFPSSRSSLLAKTSSPTEILDIKKENGLSAEIEFLYGRVEKFLLARVPFGVCSQRDFHYQDRFRDARIPPKLFYYRGDLNLLETPCISIVGSRRASCAGLAQAREIAEVLTNAGYTIVSGLAQGIDTAALEMAVGRRDGHAIGVIGTPIDHYYPKENRKLQNEIAGRHLLISHVPFYRYENEPFKNRRYYFPRRNAIMSVISQATVIVEASETSGTRSQADAAVYQGRKLLIMERCFAQSDWPARFVPRGAVRVQDTKQLLEELEQDRR